MNALNAKNNQGNAQRKPTGKPVASGKKTSAVDTYESLALRHDFYKDVAKKMTRIAIASGAVAMVSIFSAAAIITFGKQPQNYGVYPDGKIIPLESLAEGESQSAVINLAAEAATASFSFDFKNYNRQLGSLRTLYDEEGYNDFLTALSPMVEKVKEGNYVSFAAITQTPIIVKSGQVNGVQMYKIQTAIMVSLEGQAKRVPPETWNIEIVVKRVPRSKFPLGLAVSRLVAKPTK